MQLTGQQALHSDAPSYAFPAPCAFHFSYRRAGSGVSFESSRTCLSVFCATFIVPGIMQNSLQILFRDIPSSEAMDAEIRKRVAKLEKLCGDLIGCQVSVESEANHKQQGKLYRVRVDLKARGAELVVDGSRTANEDAYVALRDSFDAMTRQLEEYVQRRRGDVKSHSA
jgi:ribosomal subunit interface protein